MLWLFAQTWQLLTLSFLAGALVTWLVLVRGGRRVVAAVPARAPAAAAGTLRGAEAPPPASRGAASGDGEGNLDPDAPLAAEAQPFDDDLDTPVLGFAAPALGDSDPVLGDSDPVLGDPDPVLSDSDRVLGDSGAVGIDATDADASRDAATGAGEAPPSRMIKGDADALLYYTPAAPAYRAAQAAVWFSTEREAQDAGFRPWDWHARSLSASVGTRVVHSAPAETLVSSTGAPARIIAHSK